MSGLGTLIVGGMLLIAVAGLVLVVSAFARRPIEGTDVPIAQVIDNGKMPRLPRRRWRVSMGRLAFGIVLIVLGAVGAMFIFAIAGLASMANH